MARCDYCGKFVTPTLAGVCPACGREVGDPYADVSSSTPQPITPSTIHGGNEIKFACPDCDGHILADRSFSERTVQCPHCSKHVKMVPLEVAASPATLETHYLAAIPKILYRLNWQQVVLGDIYLSRDWLIYIYYGGFRSTNPVVGGAAALLLGGVTGLVTTAWADGAVRDAMPHYQRALTESWGMAPERRATMWPSIAVRRDALKAMETKGGIVFQTVDGDKLVFGYPGDSPQDKISRLLGSWFAGSLELQNSAYESGIIPIAKPPYDIIEEAKNGTWPSPKIYAHLQENQLYAHQLLALFLQQKYKVKKKTLRMFADGPPKLMHLLEFRLDLAAGGMQKPFIAVIALIILIISLCIFARAMVYISNDDTKGRGLFLGVGMFVMPIVALYSGFAIACWNIRRRDQVLLSMLQREMSKQGKNRVSHVAPRSSAPELRTPSSKDGMNDIKFTCPDCDGHVLADRSFSEITVQCPHCSKNVKLVPIRQPDGTKTSISSPSSAPRPTTSATTRCNHCGGNVLPMAEDVCPSCGLTIGRPASPLQPSPPKTTDPLTPRRPSPF